MNLNANYLVLFCNPCDINKVQYLARQMYPRGESRAIIEAFSDPTSIVYRYHFIDFKQNTLEILRLTALFFLGGKYYIYIPKSNSQSFEHYTL